ncbi:DNA recombination protein RmuC [Picrophilus oshimae]|uniref:DNA recombination protein RmuC n=1 Tax=Picrophilus torridus (strain ATCC 700027 / DSM 9790 / JCM 10055 / NBRC 100828 / KAW 2/3) TaxID=1122961 RepID=Q6L1W6_PICTO|nr:DNA recombination protein RmuC [Picrophilus oshimae]AAT43036.1 hypothetical DUF195 protein [Picrophilus oshimae DSM 9789]SMD30662.1 DNA recombination protein RmuC [Picrophilus oshimae DSM 9789]
MLGFIYGLILGIFLGLLIFYLIAKILSKSITKSIKSDIELYYQKILDENSQKLIEKNTEVISNINEKNRLEIKNIMEPVYESLKSYREYIERVENERKLDSGSLKASIENLSKYLNEIDHDTRALANALKNPSIRGKWGEITLRRIVEIAGMNPYCDFSEQVTINNEYRPDMVINLPNGRKIIIDSKVPLNSYLNYVDETNEKLKLDHLKRYIDDFNNHVRTLESKRYWQNLEGSVDFVIMFLPLESLLSIIMERSRETVENAFSRHVIVSTPVTLISLLMTVHAGWNEKELSSNINNLMLKIKDFRSRLDTFMKDYDEIGNNLGKALESYQRTKGSLERRLEPIMREFERNLDK